MVIGKDLIKPQLTPVLVVCFPCSEPAAAVHDDDRLPAVDGEVPVVAVERGAACVVVVDATVAAAVVVVAAAAVAVARAPAGIALAAAAAAAG